MANWLQTSLDGINKGLAQMEYDKATEIRAEKRRAQAASDMAQIRAKSACLFIGEISDSKVWSTTLEEKKAMNEMRDKLVTYRSRHAVQASVLGYLKPQKDENGKVPRQYKQILRNDSEHIKDLETYIDASEYWKKRSTQIITPSGQKVKWTFAINTQFQAVICRYRGWFIVTSISSHDNIMKELEGKSPWYPIQWDNKHQPKDAVEQILELM